MKTLYSQKYAGKDVVTAFGTIHFDESGFCSVPDEAESLCELFPAPQPEIPENLFGNLESAPELPAVEPEETDLSVMSVQQLKAFAAEHDIDISFVSKKAEIRNVIEASLASNT